MPQVVAPLQHHTRARAQRRRLSESKDTESSVVRRRVVVLVVVVVVPSGRHRQLELAAKTLPLHEDPFGLALPCWNFCYLLSPFGFCLAPLLFHLCTASDDTTSCAFHRSCFPLPALRSDVKLALRQLVGTIHGFRLCQVSLVRGHPSSVLFRQVSRTSVQPLRICVFTLSPPYRTSPLSDQPSHKPLLLLNLCDATYFLGDQRIRTPALDLEHFLLTGCTSIFFRCSASRRIHGSRHCCSPSSLPQTPPRLGAVEVDRCNA